MKSREKLKQDLKDGLPHLRITMEEFENLLSYDMSFPSGVTKGKQWRRAYYREKWGQITEPPYAYVIGEYGEPQKNGKTPIYWYYPIFVVKAKTEKVLTND